MRNKFEQLIEYIINDDMEKANELFHSVVVEKSRNIYNELVAEDMDMDMDEADDPMAMDDTDDMMGDIAADEEGMDSDEMDDMGDDMDDMDDDMADMGDEEDFGDEESGADEKFGDIEDALEQLKAEFERLMSDEGEEEMPEEGVMREYIEKVAAPGNTEGQGVGSGSIGGSTNTKSTVAGKNDMGGTAKNIAQGGEAKEGAKPKVGDMGAVDPRAAGKSAFSKKAPSAKTGEESGVNKKSIVD